MRKSFLSVVVGALAILGAGSAQAGLLYQWNFDSVTPGVPTVSAGGGNLGISNSTNGLVAFAPTGGIQGGTINALSGQTYNTADPAGLATTASGTAITGLPNQAAGVGQMNQFTVSFWMKGSAAGVNASNFPRLFILGTAGTTDQGANTFAMEMRSGRVDVLANNQGTGSSNAVGNVLAADTWNFIAVTYDGTSTKTNNSTAQSTATGGLSSANAQLYEGTDLLSVTRFPVGTAINGGDFITNTGTIDFGANAALLLANRANFQRGFNGLIDDFRIYDTILTPSDVEAVRVAGALPEPASLGLLGIVGFIAGRRRNRATA